MMQRLIDISVYLQDNQAELYNLIDSIVAI